MFSLRAIGALAMSIACATGSFAGAQTASIEGIAIGRSQAVSDDGSVVVGQDVEPSWSEAFRWENSVGQVGMGSLDPTRVSQSYAYGASEVGDIVVGWTNVNSFGSPVRAFRWTRTGPTTGNMLMLNYQGDWLSESRAYDVSDDGVTVVGVGDSFATGSEVPRAYLWTGVGLPRDLGPSNDLQSESAAWGVSGDGKVVVGQCKMETPSPHAFRWTLLTGMVDLGALNSPLETSIATAVSRDGQVIVGKSGNKAFIKQGDAPMEELPPFITDQSVEVCDVSFDGRVVVGRINNRAALWIDRQPQYLSDLLAAYGVITATDWGSLDVIRGCSADGRVLIGDGRHDTLGFNVVFRAYLPLPNRLPQITSTDIFPDDTITLKLGQTFAATITGTDADLEDLTLTTTGLPSAASFNPPSGTTQASPLTTTFSFTPGINHVGTHEANVRFTDAPAGDFADLPFTIVVPPNSLPTVGAPAPVTVECDGTNRILLDAFVGDADGHRLTVEWRVNGVLEQTTNNVPAGTNTTFEFEFPDGQSEVRVRAKDAYSDWVLAETLVTVQDTTDPTITFTETVEIRTDPGVDFATKPNLPKPQVEDLCDGDPTLTNDAPAILPLGETIVNWTATDDDGNASTARQRVIVVDREAPEIVTGSDIKKFVDRGETYATVRLPVATATDNVDDALTIEDNSRPRYPIGTTKVTYTCIDDDGNIGKAVLNVEVVNRRPKANAGANVVVNTRSEKGAQVKLDGSRSSDPDKHDLKFRWSARGVRIGNATAPSPQATFPVGKTNVTLTVTDEGGAKHTDSVLVTVRLKGGGGRRSLGAEANTQLSGAASAAASSVRSEAFGAASVAGFRYAVAAERFGDAAGEFVRWNDGQSEADGWADYAQLRYVQALYGSEASSHMLKAYLESGDEDALNAALAAARGVEAAAADLATDE